MPRFRPEHVAQMLVTAGLGVIGTTIFTHTMPATCPKGYLVLDGAGGAPISEELGGWERHGFQVIARGPTYGEVSSMGDGLVTALPFRGRRTLQGPPGIPASVVEYIRAEHQPMIFPRPENAKLIEASVNFTYAALTK